MKIKLEIISEDGKLIESLEFSHDKEIEPSDVNTSTISGMLLLVIRYLSTLGPY